MPAQHYFMGGVKVDSDGKTSMNRLYAAGETACNGVHGRNRLASNSLLESLVWAKRAAIKIAEEYSKIDVNWCRSHFERLENGSNVLFENYRGREKSYRESVMARIESDKKKREAENK